MIFYYIRHGEPIYEPDSLTPLGVKQAEALAGRLAAFGLDKIYASTSNRAIMTARPTCERLGLEAELLDFANEAYPWKELSYRKEDGSGKTWLFQNPRIVNLFNDTDIREMGERWYDHPAFADYSYEREIKRIYDATDAFFAELGYEHVRHTGKYKVKASNDQRIALFAHQGFGLAFLSCLLDIPYPMFCTHFDICHSGLTVIEFSESGGYSVPKILTLSSDSHLYREDLPTLYNHRISF
jgi:probable phosphoglycerate mutase